MRIESVAFGVAENWKSFNLSNRGFAVFATIVVLIARNCIFCRKRLTFREVQPFKPRNIFEMKKLFLMLVFLSIAVSLLSQTNQVQLTDGARVLFSNVKSKLTNEEKNWIFKQLGFTLSKDKKKFLSGDFEVGVTPYVTDLNNDKKEEVFVVMQSEPVFGNVGENFSLFAKNDTGKFEKQTELGGGIAMILNTVNKGYPDIAVGGPGFEFPIYRWDGKKYKYQSILKDADLQSNKVKYKDVADYSKAYSETLK